MSALSAAVNLERERVMRILGAWADQSSIALLPSPEYWRLTERLGGAEI